jgi:hypothetical protein
MDISGIPYGITPFPVINSREKTGHSVIAFVSDPVEETEG